MKDNLQIFLLVFVFLFVGFRLYQKYIRKKDTNSGTTKNQGSSFPSTSRDDDYEPYSKK